MRPPELPQLAELERRRGRPAILYHSSLDDDAIPFLYEGLRRIKRTEGLDKRTEGLDLVLYTMGGSVSAARRVALLLREFTDDLTIMVPYRARSAGTLLCLASNLLVMGPMAELGPIDANVIASTPRPRTDSPDQVSAADVRAFRDVAEKWFGAVGVDDRLQVLALLAQRVFPPTLGALYRFDGMTRQCAEELLVHHLPGADDSRRKEIATRLTEGYGPHDYSITRADALALGLRVETPSAELEELLWDLAVACRRHFIEPVGSALHEGAVGLIKSTTYCAQRVQLRRSPTPLSGMPDEHDDTGQPFGPYPETFLTWEEVVCGV